MTLEGYIIGVLTLWFVVCALLYWITVMRSGESGIGKADLEKLLQNIAIQINDKQKAACALMYRRYRHSTRTAYLLLWVALTLVMTMICITIGVLLWDDYSHERSIRAIMELQEYLSANKMEVPTLPSFEESTLTVVTALMFRLGLVALVLYVIAVLLRLYRYQLKVADFYRSRFDAIILMDSLDNEEKSSKWMELTNPPYDVGNQQLPLDYIVKIIEAVKGVK